MELRVAMNILFFFFLFFCLSWSVFLVNGQRLLQAPNLSSNFSGEQLHFDQSESINRSAESSNGANNNRTKEELADAFLPRTAALQANQQLLTNVSQPDLVTSAVPASVTTGAGTQKEPLSSVKLRTLQTIELSPADNVRLVFAIIGTANRNPDDVFSQLQATAGAELSATRGLLTTNGKQQAYNFGAFLRQRYNSLLGAAYNGSEVVAVSSTTASCQITLQTLLASLFLPDKDSQWNDKLQWQPTPVALDDLLLNVEKTKCPAFDEVNTVLESQIEKSFGDKKRIVDYISQQAGWNSKISKLAQIGSNLEQIVLRNLSIPDWVTKNPFDLNLYGTVLHFRFLFQLACAKNDECRRLLSGSLLNQLAKDLKTKMEQHSVERMKLMSTSSDVLASIFWSLGIETAGIPSGRSLIFEFQEAPIAAVRTVLTEFVDQRPESLVVSVLRLPVCDGEWCPLKQLLKWIENDTVADIKRLCRAPDGCENKKITGIEQKDAAVGSFNHVNIIVDCNQEDDRSGSYYCQQWAKYDYCKDYISVRDYYCRYTCLCDDKFKAS